MPHSGLYSTSDDLEAGNGQEGLDNNNNNNSSRSGGSFTQNQRIEELSYIWNSIKGTILTYCVLRENWSFLLLTHP